METPRPTALPTDTSVWYVSYGSNMSATRFACYLEGGRPEGGSRANPGAHDTRPPRRDAPVVLSGSLYFAGKSPQWSGGVAFYDHEAPGTTAARAYLVTAAQFADIAAQEMYRLPEPGDPLAEVVLGGLGGEGARHHVGPGRYETLVEVGSLDGLPLLTFTSPHGLEAVAHTAPAPAYVEMLLTGLAESHGWDRARAEAYVDARVTPGPG